MALSSLIGFLRNKTGLLIAEQPLNLEKKISTYLECSEFLKPLIDIFCRQVVGWVLVKLCHFYLGEISPKIANLAPMLPPGGRNW
jgi:hypothetical protein